MGNAWDRYIVKRYFFTFSWISLAAFGVYFSSDLLFKLQSFRHEPSQIIPFYLYRSIPFFIISMPVISFFSLIIIAIQIRRRREWHIAKLICNSNMILSRSLMLCGILMLIPWLIAREWVLPNIRDDINESYREIKEGSLSEPRIVKVEDSLFYIKSLKGDYETISFQKLDLMDSSQPQLQLIQTASWDDSTQSWNSEQPITIQPPSPNDLGAKRRFFIYTPFSKLLDLLSHQSKDQVIKTALIERLLILPLFIFYFFIAAFDVIRCRHIKLVWIFPIFSLFFFTISMMGFKAINLQHGLIISLSFVLGCAVATQNLFNLYFRRKHKQGRST